MSALPLPLRDSATMLRRNLRRQLRYPVLIGSAVGVPVVMLWLFVYVFGSTLGDGLAAPGLPQGRAGYLAFVMPGIILLSVASAAQGVAISVAMDMTEGIIDRFRTMAIARASVLTGHVLGTLIQTLLAVTVVVAVAVLMGFRPTASPLEWLAACGLVGLVTFAITWLAVGIGLASRTVEGASNLPMPLMMLPFFGSGFVPTETMPAALRWFADNQPFTSVIDTLRGLLMGEAIGTSAVQAIVWSIAIAAVGYVWARHGYERRSRR